MGQPVCETIDQLLATVQDGVDDPELAYKLRTARQLTLVCAAQNATYRKTLDELDLDEQVVENLRSLGYM